MNIRHALLIAATAAIPIVGATDCLGITPASATHGNATYDCTDGRVTEFVQVPVSSLTSNFDTADFYTSEGGTFLAHMDRTVPGTVGTSFYVAVGTTAVWGVYAGDGVAAQGPVPITVTGEQPDCTPATTVPATTVPPTVAPTTSVPNDNVCDHPAFPGQCDEVTTTTAATTTSVSGHTLPPTGSFVWPLAAAGLLAIAAGGSLYATRRKP